MPELGKAEPPQEEAPRKAILSKSAPLRQHKRTLGQLEDNRSRLPLKERHPKEEDEKFR